MAPILLAFPKLAGTLAAAGITYHAYMATVVFGEHLSREAIKTPEDVRYLRVGGSLVGWIVFLLILAAIWAPAYVR